MIKKTGERDRKEGRLSNRKKVKGHYLNKKGG